MFKFLRKYNKWILAVGGTLLMITFLIPQAINALAQRAATTGGAWATIGPQNEEVPRQALDAARNDVRILMDAQAQVPALGVVDDPMHWFLLTHEADAAGLVGGLGTEQIAEEEANFLRQRFGSRADETIGRYLGVRRLIGMYTSAGKLSEQRVESAATEFFHSVDAQIVPILAIDRIDEIPEPTTEELQAQLDEYGGLNPGEGEHGFGYRLPDRVKLEWLAIPAESVREMISASGALDEVALLKHWRRKEREGEPGIPEVDVSKQIPDIVRQDLLDELTEAKLDELEKFAYDRIRSVWRQLPTENGYLVLPENWDERRVKLPELAQAIQDREPNLPTPVYEVRGDEWMTAADLRQIDGLSRASTDSFGRMQRAPELAMAAKEFHDPNDPVIEQIQARQTSPPLRTADGSIYFFRILEADRSRAPESVDEAREALVRDLKALRAYQQLKDRIESIEQEAREDSLLDVALEYDSAVQSVSRMSLLDPQIAMMMLQQGIPLQPSPTPIPGIGQAPDAARQIIERALALPQDIPLMEQDRAQRVFAMPLDDKLAIAVVELRRQRPYAVESYAMLAGLSQLQNRVLLDELGLIQGVTDAFSYETMAKRHNFTPYRSEEAEEEAETAAEGEAPVETADAS